MTNVRVNIIKLTLIMYFICFWSCNEGKNRIKQTTFDNAFQEERKQMVEEQIMKRGISDSLIIEAFLNVPRHRFVPIKYRKMSYKDRPLPIGEGQTISQPYIVAIMTQILNLSKTDKVLEIGTGSGYQAAILGELSDSVYTIEIIESLGNRANKLLREMGYDNVKVKIGDGYQGWKKYAPFDAIIVTCAPTEIPNALKNQLNEGGRIIIPVGSFYQNLVYLRKVDNKIKKEKVFPVRFVPMVDTSGKKY